MSRDRRAGAGRLPTLQAISESPDRDQVAGILLGRFELAPDPSRIHLEDFLGLPRQVLIVLGHGVQNFVRTEYAAGVARHVFHDTKFRGREGDEHPLAFNLAPINIDREAAYLKQSVVLQGSRIGLSAAAKDRMGLGDDHPLVGIELKAGVGAGFQRSCDGGGGRFHEEGDERRGGGCHRSEDGGAPAVPTGMPGDEIEFARGGKVERGVIRGAF